MSTDGHRTKWSKNIAEHFNRLNRVHERYNADDRQTTDGRTCLLINFMSMSTVVILPFLNNDHSINFINR